MDEPPFTSVPALVDAMLPALLPHFTKPFAFFGHSMGAMIGFELARQLRRETGRAPLKLFVSGQRAAQLPRTSAITYNLPEPEFLEELRRLNGTPPEVLEHPELMSLLLSLLRADFELVQTYDYQPGEPLNCPIAAFGGVQDVDIPRSHLDAWREQTTSSFSLQMFPGDHFFLHSSQALLLRCLSKHLQQIA
jgi:medium-chain acyl-[acyl-carrier-protein] hydrolase